MGRLPIRKVHQAAGLASVGLDEAGFAQHEQTAAIRKVAVMQEKRLPGKNHPAR